MIEVELPDGRIVEIETDDPAQAAQAAKKFLGNAQSAPAPVVDPSLPGPTAPQGEDMGERFTPLQNMMRQGGRDLQVGVQGVGKGVANMAGLPGDLAVGATNLGAAGIDTIAELFGGNMDSRMGPSMVGSNAISDLGADAMNAAGVAPIEKDEMSPIGKLFYNVNQYGTEGLLGGAALSKLSQAETAADVAKRAPQMGDALTNPYRVNAQQAITSDVAAGAGAGVGKTVADEYLPESMQGPVADLVSMLVGSVGGATLASGGRNVAAGAEKIAGMRSDPNVPYDGATLVPTSRNTADRAARFVQERTSNPQQAAADIGDRAAVAAREGEPMPTAGIATDDIGLNAVEKGFRTRSKVPFEESDQRLRDAAQEKVTGLRNENAEPRAAQKFVEQETQAQRDAVQAPVDAARKDLATTQETNTQTLTQAELQREKDLLDRERDLLSRERALDEAKRAETSTATQVQSLRENETAASERLAGAVGTAKQADEATKGTLYREAETLGKQTQIDPTPFVESAKAIRSDISRLAGQDPKLANILDDLDRLAPSKDDVITEQKDAAGKLVGITKGPAAAEPITATDLIAMRPRLSAARDSASKAKRGDTVGRIDEVNNGIAAELNRLADAGDAAALKWREAEGNFKEKFAPKYREGVGGQLDRADRGNNPVPPSAVASKFLKPGAGGKEAAEDLNRILKDATSETEGKAAARDYVLSDMAKVVRDGKINPDALRSWIANRSGMFQATPELRAEAEQTLRDVVAKKAATTEMQKQVEQAALANKEAAVTSQKKIAEIKANNKLSEAQKQDQIDELSRQAAQVERDIQKSATSLLIDTDPVKAAAKVFNSNDPQTAMREIVAKVSKDKEAAAGWKRAVVEHLIDKVTTTNTARTGGTEGPVSIAGLQKFFTGNEKALAEAFTPAEMNALRRAHKVIEPLGNLSRQATAGSSTKENEMLWNSLEAGLLTATGNAITTGMIMKRVRVFLKFIPDEQKKVEALVQRMFFDPELAQHLLTREVKKIESPAWNKNLARLIAAGQASADDAEEN